MADSISDSDNYNYGPIALYDMIRIYTMISRALEKKLPV